MLEKEKGSYNLISSLHYRYSNLLYNLYEIIEFIIINKNITDQLILQK